MLVFVRSRTQENIQAVFAEKKLEAILLNVC